MLNAVWRRGGRNLEPAEGIGGRRTPRPPDPPLTDDQIKRCDLSRPRIPAAEQPVSSAKSPIDNELSDSSSSLLESSWRI